jgi:UDP-GlcNAc:undecaprenyl-phosphate GlcNAc-1-phosphate transferase
VSGGCVIREATNPISGASVALGMLAIPVTVLWVIGVTNALNLIDGLDGLAAGVGSSSPARSA